MKAFIATVNGMGFPGEALNPDLINKTEEEYWEYLDRMRKDFIKWSRIPKSDMTVEELAATCSRLCKRKIGKDPKLMKSKSADICSQFVSN
ncbi:hypothetical protein IWQ61_007716 [Dispira simplex]|nr:hypothetical protein IWQ61_007716 [Dispira simplex]